MNLELKGTVNNFDKDLVGTIDAFYKHQKAIMEKHIAAMEKEMRENKCIQASELLQLLLNVRGG